MKKKNWRTCLIAACLIAILGIVIFILHINNQMKKLPGMSAYDCLEYTLSGNNEAVITIGTITNGVAEWEVYGSDCRKLPKEKHTYEIGSLTKTVTATIIEQAIMDGKISPDDTIDHYLDLPVGNSYPTISDLMTHTSGYKGYYFEKPMVGNFFARRNDYYGINREMVLRRLGRLSAGEEPYDWEYSNFGYATLGLVLEKIYGKSYSEIAADFFDENGMSNTHISNGQGDLGNYWDWNEDDAYLSAGAVVSDIEDVLKYMQLQLDNKGVFGESHRAIRTVDATSSKNALYDINVDAIGSGWIIDNKNGIIWHNGGTDNYNCYMGFDLQRGNGVVILSNLAPRYRIPATVIGIKMLKENNLLDFDLK